ncbi:hypothetical protein [Vreelandella sp. EE7]
MTRKKEDEFTSKVKDVLSRRVSQRCSNPDCRAPTAAPGETELKVSNVGVAAHIHAAAPGGARYDSTMNSKERSSISNAIWLCSTCSTVIDRNESRYSAILLRDWKKTAEDKAFKEQGTRLPTTEDAIHQTTMALTGLPKKIITSAIYNVHNATAKAIEESDPRFEVVTQFKDGKTVFEYHAKEDVSFNFEVKGEEGVKILRKIFEEGQDASLPAEYFEISGDGFPGGSTDGISQIEIKNDGIEAIHKIWLIDVDTNITEQFNDVHGKIFSGTKAMRFEGFACSEIFSLKYTRPIANFNKGSGFDISLNFSKWDGRNIKNLPYFNKIKFFFDSLFNGNELHTSLEIHGDIAFSANAKNIKGISRFKYIDSFLMYIEKARVISERMGCDIFFNAEHVYNQKEATDVYDAANILLGEGAVNLGGIKDGAEIGFILECDGIDAQDKLKIGSVLDLRVDEKGEVLKIFSQEVLMPYKITYFKSVILKPKSDILSAKKGDEVFFECVPAEGHKTECEYILNDRG